MDGDRQSFHPRRPAVRKWHARQCWEEGDSPDRLAGDRELYKILSDSEFRGPDYDEFEAVLVDYGFAVIRAWARDRLLLTKCRERHVRGLPSDPGHLMDALSTSDIEELAIDIVAEAIIIFREESLVSGRWKPTGTASLRTFFVNRCLFSTPTPVRQLLTHRRAEITCLDDPDFSGTTSNTTPDIAEHAVSKLSATDFSAQVEDLLTEREYAVLGYKDQGMTSREIAAMMNTTPKAIANSADRARAKLRTTLGRGEWTA